MNTKRWIIILLSSLLSVHREIIQSASARFGVRDFFNRNGFPEPPPWNLLLPYLLLSKIVLSSVNSVLLTILLAIYIGIYRKTRSEFSLGLIIFSIALLLYSLMSNPLIHMLAGFRLSGLGPFTMLPDLFTCIASAILLYLSRQ